MVFVNVEAPALLIGEKRLDLEATRVATQEPADGLRSRACGRFCRSQTPQPTLLGLKGLLPRPVRPRILKAKQENDKNRPACSSESKLDRRSASEPVEADLVPRRYPNPIGPQITSHCWSSPLSCRGENHKASGPLAACFLTLPPPRKPATEASAG